MKVAGSHELAATRQQVWDALQDPAVLARTLPGCQSLAATGLGSYAATLTAGVASVRGTYRGTVALSDQVAPVSYRLTAEGAGAPGTVRAEALVRLEDNGVGTTVSYEADAVIGGMIGGVGQRMLVGVAKRTAAEFFAAVERDVAGSPLAETPPGGPGGIPVPAWGAATDERAEDHAEKAFVGGASRPGRVAAGASTQQLLGAALAGAVIALAGMLVGRRLADRDGA